MTKRFRLTMLGLLCGGLLLLGIGAGVSFAEYSGFTYVGQRLPEGAQTEEQSITVPLESADKPIRISSYVSQLHSVLQEATILTSDQVEPNTVRFDVTYETLGATPVFWQDSYEEADMPDWILMSWSASSDLSVLLACKDQVLEDLRNRQLGEYLSCQLLEVTITVNPADEGRVSVE